MTPLKQILGAFVNFVYPSFCLHCRQETSYKAGPFCDTCTEHLALIKAEERCPYCFSQDYDSEKCVCYPCYIEKPTLKRTAAAFDYIGPAASLVTQMKYANQPYLAKGCGGYLALQLLNLKWPMPDVIVPVPLTLSHKLSRGYNQSFLLAKSLGSILNKPVKEILRRQMLDVSQAGMSRNKRKQLTSNSFSMKQNVNIQDLVVLLIDDVYTTGKTMNCCAEILYQGYPKDIYGLSLCRAI